MRQQDMDRPIAWIHSYGKGRVFYSNLGHNNFTFWNAEVLQHFLDGIQYALGDLEVDATPSAKLEKTHLAKARSEKIVFLAGNPSHASGEHEFRAGSILLADRLNAQTDLPIHASVVNGWPKDDTILDGSAAIVIYCDSDSVVRDHYPRLMELSKAGTGIFFMHYGVHPRNPENGQKHYMPTVGGFMETGFSVNPKWAADLTVISDHPVRRGCEEPIPAFDEFYYSLRFHPKSFPIVEATPTKDNMVEGSNLWNENATKNYGKKVPIVWGFERPDGTRGGGFTGGHYHRNWAIPGFRKSILNTIVWMAGLEVPEGGIKSRDPDGAELNANLDKKKSMIDLKLPLKKPMEYRNEALERKRSKKKPKPGRKKRSPKFRNLLDSNLSDWDIWMGVPHKSVKIPGQPPSTSEDGTKGTPLGLNNDPLGVFKVIEENGKPVLKISGEIYGGLTSKEEFKNYHLTLQFKWGKKKFEPRLNKRRDSGVLLHCVGRHGTFWNVWKRSLECQIQEGDVGDFFALAGAKADVPSIIPGEGKRPIYQRGAPLRTISNNAQRSASHEKTNGEWNTVEIYALDDRLVHVVNGKINMVLLNTRQNTPQGPAPLTKGQIQIQSEAAEIFYRDIKIRPIKEFPPAIKEKM